MPDNGEAPPDAAGELPHPGFGTGTRVLVVEDEAIVRLYLQNLLADFDLEACGFAGNGGEALAIAAEQRPAVALVDIGLSGAVDGIAVAQQMVERYGTAIIFLSGNAEAERDSRVVALKPVAFLAKPYFPEELESALAKAFAVT